MANQPKKYKKFVATAATATLVASAIVPVASAASLTDIAGNTHEEAIKALVDAKVINGYADGTFKPNQTLTRSDVVKLLGKYLVSQGHSIPTDAVTNPRFNDLTSKSNKELLEYAAVVADAGVFAGSNGKLLAADQITRENMAIVLVRMINTLKDVSLEEFVGSQNFNGDVKDLNVAKAEARTAIQVLDFYDITNPSVANFNPKGNTTRGQFATFLHKTINADFSGAAATTGTVKAINNTTVEVTFGDAITDIKALDFKINGLEVSNAVVKQTDAKTAVLTTSPQTAGVEYTVTVNENTVGKFTGVSAVLPEKVEFSTQSIQGVYGQQVTVSAKVTVATGQSAAGIPITFNIDSNKDAAGGQFAKDYTAEVFTDANGVASYTYTQYNPNNSEDVVTAYATGKANVRANAMVYWGNAARLAVTEVTTQASIANSATKVYQVKSTENRNGFVFVTFKENKGVTPDKVTNGVTFTDANVYSVDANGNFSSAITNGVPFEVTTGGHQVAVVKLNAEGVGNFTLTGADATVTPVVYAGKYTLNAAGTAITVSTDAKHDGTDLQAVANPAVFALSQVADMTIVAEGKANAAARNADSSSATAGVGTGGREYKITLKGKDGKVAPANTDVVIFFEQATTGNSNRVNHNVTLVSDDVSYPVTAQPTGSTNLNAGIKLKTNNKGEIEFSVHGANNDFVTPIAVYDNGKTAGVLDTSDLKVVGETTYFGAAVIGGSRIDILDETGKVVDDSTVTSNIATIRYVAVDQNGFDYYNASSREFDATFVLSDAFTAYTTNATEVSKENNRTTYKVKAVNGIATLVINKTSTGAGQLSYTASTTNNIVAPQSGVVKFGTAADRAIITGKVTAFDTTKNEITLVPTNSTVPVTLSYAGADWFYKGSAAGVTEAYFESKLAVGVEITYNKATETTKAKFDITADATATNTAAALQAAIISATAKADAAVAGTAEGQYPAAAITNLRTAIATATTAYNNATLATPAQIAAAITALTTAVETFDKAVIGNQKAALTTELAEAKALAASVTAFSTAGTPARVWGTDNKANEVQAASLTALNNAITTAEVLLADSGAVSADFAAQLAVLTTAITNVEADLNTYNNAKSTLQTAITVAERAHAAAVTGQGNGMFSAADKATLLAAINAAKAVLNGTTTTVANLNSAVAPLNAAKATFDSSKISHTISLAGTTTLVLTFASSEGLIIEDGVTNDITLGAGTTATVATGKAEVTNDDELTITVTTPALDQVIVLPVTINGQVVKFTLTYDGSAWNVTSQDPANFVDVQ